MSIHKHTISRLDSKLDRMIKQINPLNDLINLYGYDSLDNSDKKEFAKMSHRIKKLNHRINIIK